MSAHQLMAAQAHLDVSRLRTRQLTSGEWRRLVDARARLADAPLFVDDTPAITLPEVRARCHRLLQENGVQLVVLDYQRPGALRDRLRLLKPAMPSSGRARGQASSPNS